MEFNGGSLQAHHLCVLVHGVNTTNYMTPCTGIDPS